MCHKWVCAAFTQSQAPKKKKIPKPNERTNEHRWCIIVKRLRFDIEANYEPIKTTMYMQSICKHSLADGRHTFLTHFFPFVKWISDHTHAQSQRKLFVSSYFWFAVTAEENRRCVRRQYIYGLWNRHFFFSHITYRSSHLYKCRCWCSSSKYGIFWCRLAAKREEKKTMWSDEFDHQ